jgi:hypothetical protein
MRNVVHKIQLVVVYLIGSAGTIYLYYFGAIRKANSFNEAIFYFIGSLGVLIGTNVLVQVIEWAHTRQYTSAMIGHFTDISDIQYLERGGKAWKENYSLRNISFQRPPHGCKKQYISCSHGCNIQIEIWSHRTALRNKVILVSLYGLYGFLWLFLLNPSIDISTTVSTIVPDWATELVIVFVVAPFLLTIIFFFIGLYYLFSPCMGTANGIGSHFGFLGSRTIDTAHKIFANEKGDFFAPWTVSPHSSPRSGSPVNQW